MIDSTKLKELSDLIAREIREIATSNKNLLPMFPIGEYIEYIRKYPLISNYGYVSQEVINVCKGIVHISSEQMLELYHQLLLVSLILMGHNEIERKRLPEDIKGLYSSNFERITRAIESGNYIGSYNYTNDKFCKDLAVCSLRMIPAGAQKIHVNGIARRILVQKGISQFVEVMTYVLFELGGFKPLFEMHTDSNDPELMGDFNEGGWIKFYRRVSELLKIQPDIKGVFGSGWVFDPELEKISPRLVYLRRIVTDNGGKLFYVGPSAKSIKDATLKSPTRRRLYRENRYMPTAYLVIWSRTKLISWADRERETKSGRNGGGDSSI